MKAGDRFGGHMVSGHVDGIGMVTYKREEGNAWVLTFSAPGEIMETSVPKGSVAIDGISLTLNEVLEDSLTVSIIPHTVKMTTLSNKGVGSRVNLESDIIGKYLYHILRQRGAAGKAPAGKINMGFLSEHGFL
jgi:riboflavin synthase